MTPFPVGVSGDSLINTINISNALDLRTSLSDIEGSTCRFFKKHMADCVMELRRQVLVLSMLPINTGSRVRTTAL